MPSVLGQTDLMLETPLAAPGAKVGPIRQPVAEEAGDEGEGEEAGQEEPPGADHAPAYLGQPLQAHLHILQQLQVVATSVFSQVIGPGNAIKNMKIWSTTNVVKKAI